MRFAMDQELIEKARAHAETYSDQRDKEIAMNAYLLGCDNRRLYKVFITNHGGTDVKDIIREIEEMRRFIEEKDDCSAFEYNWMQRTEKFSQSMSSLSSYVQEKEVETNWRPCNLSEKST